MSVAEWLAQGVLLALLGAGLPLAWRLERQIAALRREGGALEAGAAGIGEATAAAEAALTRLRATAEGAGRAVAERVAVAEPLRDDLRYLAERAEALADRLDGLVRAARPAAGAALAEAQPVPAPRSEAERDLLRALRELR
jgi:ABC-type transporter Mla subunit MlaD